MKKTYQFEVTEHLTFHRDCTCPFCGEHLILFYRQLSPTTDTPYHIECSNCNFSSSDGKTKQEALENWKTIK